MCKKNKKLLKMLIKKNLKKFNAFNKINFKILYNYILNNNDYNYIFKNNNYFNNDVRNAYINNILLFDFNLNIKKFNNKLILY